jgi:hypothetical protein
MTKKKSSQPEKVRPKTAVRLPILAEPLERQIYHIRGQRVMLSPDLARLYQVEPRALIQAVKRNLDRFPKDFMFALSRGDYANLKSQIVISSWGGARRARPYAFTELGVAMLSSVLNSKRAVHVNILIMRAFVKVRQTLATYADLAKKIEELEGKFEMHDDELRSVFTTLKELIEPLPAPVPPKRRIGFGAALR